MKTENNNQQKEISKLDVALRVIIFLAVTILVVIWIGENVLYYEPPKSNQSNEYWGSVKTEKMLKDYGMDGAAKRERKYRQEELYKK